MHKSESVQENKTHKILWDFEIQRDHRRSDIVIIDKKKKEEGTCCPIGQQSENQRKQNKRLRPCPRTEKAVEHEGHGDYPALFRSVRILRIVQET